MTRPARHLMIAALVGAAIGLPLLRAHWREDDARRAELAECREEALDARTDTQREHAVADACLGVLVSCRDALDSRGFCSLWVEP